MLLFGWLGHWQPRIGLQCRGAFASCWARPPTIWTLLALYSSESPFPRVTLCFPSREERPVRQETGDGQETGDDGGRRPPHIPVRGNSSTTSWSLVSSLYVLALPVLTGTGLRAEDPGELTGYRTGPWEPRRVRPRRAPGRRWGEVGGDEEFGSVGAAQSRSTGGGRRWEEGDGLTNGVHMSVTKR